MNTRKWIGLILILLALSAGFGYSIGYRDGTGLPVTSLFTREHQESVGLSENITVKTLEEARQVVAEAVKDKSYGHGYNCLDYSWDGMRALRWDDQPGAIAGVMFEGGKGHTLVLTATTDDYWVYLDAESGMEVHPVPGGYLNGKRIEYVYIFVLHQVGLEDFLKNPVFVVIEE